jgi:hypothetical protein
MRTTIAYVYCALVSFWQKIFHRCIDVLKRQQQYNIPSNSSHSLTCSLSDIPHVRDLLRTGVLTIAIADTPLVSSCLRDDIHREKGVNPELEIRNYLPQRLKGTKNILLSVLVPSWQYPYNARED